jgi:hypothetical protein
MPAEWPREIPADHVVHEQAMPSRLANHITSLKIDGYSLRHPVRAADSLAIWIHARLIGHGRRASPWPREVLRSAAQVAEWKPLKSCDCHDRCREPSWRSGSGWSWP